MQPFPNNKKLCSHSLSLCACQQSIFCLPPHHTGPRRHLHIYLQHVAKTLPSWCVGGNEWAAESGGITGCTFTSRSSSAIKPHQIYGRTMHFLTCHSISEQQMTHRHLISASVLPIQIHHHRECARNHHCDHKLMRIPTKEICSKKDLSVREGGDHVQNAWAILWSYPGDVFNVHIFRAIWWTRLIDIERDGKNALLMEFRGFVPRNAPWIFPKGSQDHLITVCPEAHPLNFPI